METMIRLIIYIISRIIQMEINIDQYKMETMIRLIIYIISRIILFMIHYSFYS